MSGLKPVREAANVIPLNAFQVRVNVFYENAGGNRRVPGETAQNLIDPFWFAGWAVRVFPER